MKTFKAKSSVKRAIVKEFGTKVFEAGKVVQAGAEWSFEPNLNEEDQALFDQTGHVECPNCKTHLSNGLDGYDYAIGDHDPKRVAWAKSMKLLFNCLACDTEFGPKIKESPEKTKRVYENSSSCLKPCEVVWNIAEKMKGSKRKEILAECEKAGVTFYTARTQYQKYMEACRGDGTK